MKCFEIEDIFERANVHCYDTKVLGAAVSSIKKMSLTVIILQLQG